MKKRLFVVVASVIVVGVSAKAATSFTEDFSTDPLQNGWSVFGNTNLFQWDATNHDLAVTWDSTQPNSYFYRRLDGYLTRSDDFVLQFDLRLHDAASGVEPGKTTAMQIALGFENYAVATAPGYLRGYLEGVSNVAEFNYYPAGSYNDWTTGQPVAVPPSCVPTFISAQVAVSPNTLTPYYVLELPREVMMHIAMAYTASNQTAVVTITTNGVSIGSVAPLVLNSPTNSNFATSDDYNVDMFSISSFTSVGDDYDSILAHGVVANLQLTLPPPAQNLVGAFSNGVWQVQFDNHTNWLYTLQRTKDFVAWQTAADPVAGNGTSLVLQDTNAPTGNAFYRVRADRP